MSLFETQSTTPDERRRTILAVVLSTVIVSVGFYVQNTLFPPAEPAPQTAAQQTTAQQTATPSGTGQAASQTPAPASIVPAAASAAVQVGPVPAEEQTYVIETDVVRATFSNKGGEITSLLLKNHKDRYGSVDLLVPGSAGANGLSLSFGNTLAPVRSLMSARWLDESKSTIEFSGMFEAAVAGSDQKVPFILKKIYSFRNGEYMFGFAVTIEQPEGKMLALGSNGVAYRIDLGPQIGPRFDHLPKNADYRKFIAEVAGKKKLESPKPNTPTLLGPNASWVALSGKYFTLISIPQAPLSGYEVFTGQDPSIKQTNSIGLLRSTLSASSQTDTYYFYFGPKTAAELGKYEYADKNAFGLSAMRLEDAMEGSGMLGWLEKILKFFLNFFYSIIPNYGIAIILVTVLIKALFYPLTKKSSMSTARMAELQPKIQELQAKYKGNPQKLNQEMAELYKRENYNPMSGCLPLLIQFPLFIAMYNLFNNHFDLRGAMFIPGWISDLSLPESIVHFGDFRLPLLGWSDLRALPIIYLVSQLLYGKFTQAPQSTQGGSQSASQMKFMMYGMPIMFFFILYDVPSGLLIYWITNNILTIAQQMVINDLMKKHKIAAAAAGASSAGASGPMGTAGGASAGTAGSARLAGGRNSAVDTKARPAGRVQSGESFSEKVTRWLESKAAQSEKGQNGQTGRKGSGKARPKDANKQ